MVPCVIDYEYHAADKKTVVPSAVSKVKKRNYQREYTTKKNKSVVARVYNNLIPAFILNSIFSELCHYHSIFFNCKIYLEYEKA